MENLITLIVVALILVFHRAIGALLGGVVLLGALGLMLVLVFILVRLFLFGT